MGIGEGAQSLWKHPAVSKCEKVIKFSQLSNILSTDHNARIAIDSSISVQANISVIWGKIFGEDPNSEAEIKNFNEDYIVDQTKIMLHATNKKFKNANLIPVWCFEGERNQNKLATEKRISKSLPDRIELVQLYIKLKKSAGNNLNCINKVKQFEYVEEIIDAVGLNPDDIVFNPIKENFNSLFQMFYSKIRTTQIRTKSMMKRIYEVFNESCFETIRIPEIPEAEKLCVILTHIGYCRAVFSTDSDVIVLGAKFIFFNKRFTKEEKLTPEYREMIRSGDSLVSFYSYHEIIHEMQITPEKLLLFAILLGNDFNEKVTGDGLKTIPKKLSDPTFNIYTYNEENCNTLKIDVCLEMLSITKEEKNIVKAKLLE